MYGSRAADTLLSLREVDLHRRGHRVSRYVIGMSCAMSFKEGLIVVAGCSYDPLGGLLR